MGETGQDINQQWGPHPSHSGREMRIWRTHSTTFTHPFKQQSNRGSLSEGAQLRRGWNLLSWGFHTNGQCVGTLSGVTYLCRIKSHKCQSRCFTILCCDEFSLQPCPSTMTNFWSRQGRDEKRPMKTLRH